LCTDPAAAATPVSVAHVRQSHGDIPRFPLPMRQVHQQNMMQDAVRTGAYQSAILSNPTDFAGRVVMDVVSG
jgi:hypothetical protein